MISSGLNNITDYLFSFAKANPDKPALLNPARITFSEFCSLTEKYGRGFLNSGIIKGTKTVVLVSSGIDLFAITYALLRIGAVPIMIDPGMGVKNMAIALSKTSAKAFIGIPKAHLLRILYPKAFSSVDLIFIKGSNLFFKGIDYQKFKELKDHSFEVCHVHPDDDIAVFFTSGSTGPAKGVIYKHRILEAQIHYLKNHFRYDPDGIDMCTFPLIGMLAISMGLSVVMADMDMTHPARLDPRKLINNIRQFSCTHMFCSPMVLQKLADYCNANNIKLLSLKRVFTASAPVKPLLLKMFRKVIREEAVIHVPFGSTEVLSITDITDLELKKLYLDLKDPAFSFCLGSPLENIDLEIIKITDNPVECWEDAEVLLPGNVGEIVVKGPNVTQQYLSNDHADSISKIKGNEPDLRWHRTGDLGKVDISGRLWYYGRKSQRVVTDNKTFFTIPCEAVFNQHQQVERSALVGIDLNGQIIPVICIELKEGVKCSEKIKEELLNLASENEWSEMVTHVLFHQKFPVDPRHNAKIYREKLALWAKKRIR